MTLSDWPSNFPMTHCYTSPGGRPTATGGKADRQPFGFSFKPCPDQGRQTDFVVISTTPVDLMGRLSNPTPRPVQRRLGRAEIDTIINNYQAGQSLRAIAKLLDIHHHTIAAQLQRRGIARRLSTRQDDRHRGRRGVTTTRRRRLPHGGHRSLMRSNHGHMRGSALLAVGAREANIRCAFCVSSRHFGVTRQGSGVDYSGMLGCGHRCGLRAVGLAVRVRYPSGLHPGRRSIQRRNRWRRGRSTMHPGHHRCVTSSRN